MEAILSTFGIDARLIVIQIINFGLLLGALWYFLYAPVMGMLKNREDKIRQGVADAEAAAAARAHAETEKQSILTAAESEAAAVEKRATDQAKEKSQGIVKAAEARAEDLLQDARLRGVEIANQARRDSEQEIAQLAILAAEKVLREKSS